MDRSILNVLHVHCRNFLCRLCDPIDTNSAYIIFKYMPLTDKTVLFQAAICEEKNYLGAIYEGKTNFRKSTWYTPYFSKVKEKKNGHEFIWNLLFVTRDKIFKFSMYQIFIGIIDVEPESYELSIVMMMKKRQILLKKKQRVALRKIELLQLLDLTTRFDELLLG